MTAATAPSGLKLDEEQLVFMYGMSADAKTVGLFIDDWRTLRAACNDKDAEIARLTAERDSQQRCAIDALSRATRAEAERDAALRTCAALQKECDANSHAEARLAAMASVTEADIAAAGQAIIKGFEHVSERDVNGKSYRSIIACCWARAALEAFVANKNAGGAHAVASKVLSETAKAELERARKIVRGVVIPDEPKDSVQ